jgi:multiple antibiotic resistance protein
MDIKELLSVTLILFSIIDIVGSIPILLNFQQKGLQIEAGKATIASGVIMVAFLFLGERLLGLFGVDLHSFAVAGGIVIFIIAIEMILGIHLMRSQADTTSASIVPVAFPIIAGAGTLTTILSIKVAYQIENILLGIVVNLAIVYLVIRSSGWIQAKIGNNGAEVLRKAFGIILLAIAIKLIKMNLGSVGVG